jgi:hypothetical protein
MINQKRIAKKLLVLALIVLVSLNLYAAKIKQLRSVLGGLSISYIYRFRSLAPEDFENIEFLTSLEDLVKKVGKPNGVVNYSMGESPYYELENGRYARILTAYENDNIERVSGISIYELDDNGEKSYYHLKLLGTP